MASTHKFIAAVVGLVLLAFITFGVLSVLALDHENTRIGVAKAVACGKAAPDQVVTCLDHN